MTTPHAPLTPAPDRRERSRYASAERRQSQRKGKERGAWVFIPAAELRAAGLDPAAPAPQYKVWAKAGAVLVRLYPR